MMDIVHVPVMLEEVLEMLGPRDSGIYIDATLGLGGHAEGILGKAPGATLIGIDRDEKALDIARERLGGYRNIHIARAGFSAMKEIVNDLGHDRVNGILIDAGTSMLHLRSESRGFSFTKDEPLDMRMDQEQALTAEDVVNTYSEKDLADIIWKYGEERFSRRIARAVVRARGRKPVASCRELADIVAGAVKRRGKIHPATRTFQAIRIEVNRELEELSAAVRSGAELLEKQGRFCVISYHSLEDRIIKNAFKQLAAEGLFRIITKKPLVPGENEIKTNPSSRSAKMRGAEKI